MHKLFRPLLMIAIAWGYAEAVKADVKDVKSAKEATAKLKGLIDQIESKSKELKLNHTHFWADKVGDLSRDLIDVLDEVGSEGADHEINKIFRELHGSYLNLRATVKQIPNPDVRRSLLKDTLDQYYEVQRAIYGGKYTKTSVRPLAKDGHSSNANDSETDGLPQPLVDAELDGADTVIKKEPKNKS
ncbi:MAG: hypothetical protein ACLQU5_15105 [Isosphaeraceae bacterium]